MDGWDVPIDMQRVMTGTRPSGIKETAMAMAYRSVSWLKLDGIGEGGWVGG